ncbi:hypothetical protein LTR22_001869 [Elasticomyces elasticus]|nr:hypothetical protein LTR22_001869 [Elasticomyces elasticus]
MHLLLFLCCALLLACQAAAPSSISTGVDLFTFTSTRSCTKPPATVFIYTSDGSTYIVTNLGSTSLATTDVSAPSQSPSPSRDPGAGPGDPGSPTRGIASNAATGSPVSATDGIGYGGTTTNTAASQTSSANGLSSSGSGSADGTGATTLSSTSHSECPIPSTVTITTAEFSGSGSSSSPERTVTSFIYGRNATCPAPATLPALTVVRTETTQIAFSPTDTVPLQPSNGVTSGQSPATITSFVYAQNATCPSPTNLPPVTVVITASSNRSSTLSDDQYISSTFFGSSLGGVVTDASTLWRTSVSYVFGTGMSCPTASTTTVYSYLSSTNNSPGANTGQPPSTSGPLQSSQRDASSTYATNGTSALPPSCPQTFTTYQPGSVVTLTSYQSAASCPAMTTLPAVTSYVYRATYPSAGRNASYITLTQTVVDSASYAAASATGALSLVSSAASTSLISLNSSLPTAETIYSCLSSVNGTVQAFPQPSTLTVTSFNSPNLSAAAVSDSSSIYCPTQSSLGVSTITSFIPVSGNTSQCLFNTTRETYYTTIYGPRITVTQYATTTAPPSNALGGSSASTSNATDSSSTSTSSLVASLEPAQSQAPVVANASSLQQQSSSSNPEYVTAQVVNPDQNPPIPANSNSSFLLVTFGSGNDTSSSSASNLPTAGSSRKRQASTQPLVYNATQSFTAVAGGVYSLSAYAADALNGDSPPNCAIGICADDMCGPSQPISTSFMQYSYTYNSTRDAASQVATFSIQCIGQAYVALDNVTVSALYVPPSASASSASAQGAASSSTRRASVRTVTTSIFFTTTAYATLTTERYSHDVSYVVSTEYGTATSYQEVTQTLSSVQISTTILVMNNTLITSEYYSTVLYRTVTATESAFYTYTTSAPRETLTSTLDETVTLYSTLPASTYITSDLITSTFVTSKRYTTTLAARTRFRNITQTQSGYNITRTIGPSTVYLSGPTQTTTELSRVVSTGWLTVLVTTTSQPPPFTTSYALNASTVTLTPSPSVLILTSFIPITYYRTETTTDFSLEIRTLTFTSLSLLPQQTTTLYSTRELINIAPGNTSYPPSTLIVTSIQPASTATYTLENNYTTTQLLGPSTLILTSTQPASSIYITQTSVQETTLLSSVVQTVSFVQTIVSTAQPATETLVSLSYVPTSTVRVTSTLPPATLISTLYQNLTETSVLPASTVVETFTLPASTLRITEYSELPASTFTLVSTYSLPQETTTALRYTTPPAETATFTSLSIQPASTLLIISTEPAVTQVVTLTTLSDRLVYQTETLPGSTITQTSYPPTSTILVTETSVQDPSTLLIVSTAIQNQTIVESLYVTTTEPPVTLLSSYPITYTFSQSPPPASTVYETSFVTTTLLSSYAIVQTLPASTEYQTSLVTTVLLSSYPVTYTTSLFGPTQFQTDYITETFSTSYPVTETLQQTLYQTSYATLTILSSYPIT